MNRSDGLGLSVSFYLAALLCGLMLFALPVYFMNSGTTLANPGVAAYDPPPGATLIRRADPNAEKLAVLRHQDIVTPAQIAAVNARGGVAEKPHRTVTRTAQREHERADGPVADLRYAQPAPHRGFFFGLF
jgi:hypothetical protein